MSNRRNHRLFEISIIPLLCLGLNPPSQSPTQAPNVAPGPAAVPGASPTAASSPVNMTVSVLAIVLTADASFKQLEQADRKKAKTFRAHFDTNARALTAAALSQWQGARRSVRRHLQPRRRDLRAHPSRVEEGKYSTVTQRERKVRFPKCYQLARYIKPCSARRRALSPCDRPSFES